MPVEERVLKVAVPPGSRFKGYESYVVQDLVVQVSRIRYQRERWQTPDGKTITAPLPAEIEGHFGAGLRRHVLMQYYQGQVTIERLTTQLNDLGLSISKRQVARLLSGGVGSFLAEDKEVLRAGLETAAWVSVDDTGARHKGANGTCTQIGNDHFTWFATRQSKSRLNFLDLLRAGHPDYVVNEQALASMQARHLAGPVIASLSQHGSKSFADEATWTAHLKRLGLTDLKTTPDPVRIATEGALWGSIVAHRLLADAVIVSDDAGQFNVGRHALCWVHAERLIQKLDTFNDHQRKAVARIRARVWRLYAALKAYQRDPTAKHKARLEKRFDAIFSTRTGFATLDRLLARLRANNKELLLVLDRPDIPLHTNGSENDIRCQVTKRKISAGTRSDHGRDCRDAFLGLMKTCQKLGISFWDYLGNRINLQNAPIIPPLPDLIRARASPN